MSVDLKSKVQDLVDTSINPAIAAHGGWVELLDVKDSVVYLQMGGGCQGCGAADITLKAGIERLSATLEACASFLPSGTRVTRPEGGMNVWVRLPEPLDAGELIGRAEREGVGYLPGRYFAVSRLEPGALRLSFAGLKPEEIRKGLAVLGQVFSGERERAARSVDPAPAMV